MTAPATTPSTDDTTHLTHVVHVTAHRQHRTYEVLHPDTCPTYTNHDGTIGHECLVGNEIDAIGILEALGVRSIWGTDTPHHLDPGYYRIQGWATVHHPHGQPDDYNSGIEFLDNRPHPTHPGFTPVG